MRPRTPLSLALKIVTAGFITAIAGGMVCAQENSRARVVRLSFIEGDVTVQRPDVPAWAEAPVNTPLQEGFKLATGGGSFAKIQFENGGTIRLGEQSLLDLTQLELAPDGGMVNRVDLRQGYATFHPLTARAAESLQVSTPYSTILAAGGTEFRVDVNKGAQRVEVFEGSVEVQSSSGNSTIEKDSVLLLQPGTSDPTVVSQGITKDDWDNWVDDRDAHAQLPNNAPPPNTYGDEAGGMPYGWNDLLQYGTWNDVPGWGYGWTPATVAAGWSPYTMGQWCWYPGWGYTWVGAEPWGWLPYHFGGWEWVPARGWVWFPGSLRNWSPAQVTWFHGSNWVGWTPRHIKESGNACATNCGGGVVSTSTFRNGGLLTSNAMLGFNPTSGERVREPGISPAMGAKLAGPAVSYGVAVPPASTITYDPQHHGYVNSGRVTTPPSQPAWPATVNSTTTPTSNSRPVQPVPVEGRGYEGQPAGSQGRGEPNPVVGTSTNRSATASPWGGPSTYASPANHGNTTRPAPSGSNGSSYTHGGGGQSGGSHVGGGSAGGSHGGGGGGGGHH